MHTPYSTPIILRDKQKHTKFVTLNYLLENYNNGVHILNVSQKLMMIW